MRLVCNIGGKEYTNIVQGTPFNDEFNETLDSASLIMTTDHKIKIKPNEMVYIYDKEGKNGPVKETDKFFINLKIIHHDVKPGRPELFIYKIFIPNGELFFNETIKRYERYKISFFMNKNEEYILNPKKSNEEVLLFESKKGNTIYLKYEEGTNEYSGIYRSSSLKNRSIPLNIKYIYKVSKKYLVVQNYRQEYIRREKTYKYTINLKSETSLLEGIQCPNLEITQHVNPFTHKFEKYQRSVAFYIEHYLDLYSPKIKVIDNAEKRTWKYVNKFTLKKFGREWEKLQARNCPEMSFTQDNLKTVLNKLANVCDLMPKMEKNVIRFINISKETGMFDDRYCNMEVVTQDSSEYMDGARVSFQGAINNSQLTHHVKNIGFRDRTSGLLVSTQNFKIEFEHPIYKINNFAVKYVKELKYVPPGLNPETNQPYTEKDAKRKKFVIKYDISNLILLNSVRKNLDPTFNLVESDGSPSSSIVINSFDDMSKYKYLTLGYDIGGTTISGFSDVFDKPYDDFIRGDTNEKFTIMETIMNYLNFLFPYGDGNFEDELSDKSGGNNDGYIIEEDVRKTFVDDDKIVTFGENKFTGLFFEISYYSMNNFDMNFYKKESDGEYIKRDNQSTSLAIVDNYSSHEQAKINRFGNEEIELTSRVTDVSDIQPIGSLYIKYKEIVEGTLNEDRTSFILNGEEEPTDPEYELIYKNIINNKKYLWNDAQKKYVEAKKTDLSEDYIIYHRSVSIQNYFINCEYKGTKKYLLKDYFTNVSAKHRVSPVASYNESILRNEIRNTFIKLDTEYEYGDTNLSLVSKKIYGNCDAKILEKKKHQLYTHYEVQNSVTVLVPDGLYNILLKSPETVFSFNKFKFANILFDPSSLSCNAFCGIIDNIYYKDGQIFFNFKADETFKTEISQKMDDMIKDSRYEISKNITFCTGEKGFTRLYNGIVNIQYEYKEIKVSKPSAPYKEEEVQNITFGDVSLDSEIIDSKGKIAQYTGYDIFLSGVKPHDFKEISSYTQKGSTGEKYYLAEDLQELINKVDLLYVNATYKSGALFDEKNNHFTDERYPFALEYNSIGVQNYLGFNFLINDNYSLGNFISDPKKDVNILDVVVNSTSKGLYNKEVSVKGAKQNYYQYADQYGEYGKPSSRKEGLELCLGKHNSSSESLLSYYVDRQKLLFDKPLLWHREIDDVLFKFNDDKILKDNKEKLNYTIQFSYYTPNADIFIGEYFTKLNDLINKDFLLLKNNFKDDLLFTSVKNILDVSEITSIAIAPERPVIVEENWNVTTYEYQNKMGVSLSGEILKRIITAEELFELKEILYAATAVEPISKSGKGRLVCWILKSIQFKPFPENDPANGKYSGLLFFSFSNDEKDKEYIRDKMNAFTGKTYEEYFNQYESKSEEEEEIFSAMTFPINVDTFEKTNFIFYDWNFQYSISLTQGGTDYRNSNLDTGNNVYSFVNEPEKISSPRKFYSERNMYLFISKKSLYNYDVDNLNENFFRTKNFDANKAFEIVENGFNPYIKINIDYIKSLEDVINKFGNSNTGDEIFSYVGLYYFDKGKYNLIFGMNVKSSLPSVNVYASFKQTKNDYVYESQEYQNIRGITEEFSDVNNKKILLGPSYVSERKGEDIYQKDELIPIE